MRALPQTGGQVFQDPMSRQDLGSGPFDQGDLKRRALSPTLDLLQVAEGLLEVGQTFGQGIARRLEQEGQTLGTHARPFRADAVIPSGGTPRSPWNEGSNRSQADLACLPEARRAEPGSLSQEPVHG
jgi:hypothetical protein